MEANTVCSNGEYGNMNGEPCCQIDENNQIFNQPKNWHYRPHSALARALYEKHIADEHLERMAKSQWYECNLQEIPDDISEKFVQLSLDEDTDTFLKRSIEKSDWIFTQLWHSFAKAVLSWFMTQTSINGFLGRGSMFVLSLQQFLKLLGVEGNGKRKTLIDLGAGDGEVTKMLAPLFEEVFVTEMSSTMQGALLKRGYKLLGIEEWAKGNKYDMISCLNLLDRCDTPLSLLHQIRDSLNENGLLIVALVLPFYQYVESGRVDHKPTEKLPINGSTFEQQVASAICDMFLPAGFEIISWTRVPYLCEGDLRQSYYWLDDAVFILKRNSEL